MAYTAEARERKRQELNQTNNNMSQTQTVEEKQPKANYNKEYHEYKLDVETVMKGQRDGTQVLNFHMCTLAAKPIKSVWIEPKRAEQMNRCFESRKLIYLPAGDPRPDAVKRISKEDEDGSLIWKDEFIASK